MAKVLVVNVDTACADVYVGECGNSAHHFVSTRSTVSTELCLIKFNLVYISSLEINHLPEFNTGMYLLFGVSGMTASVSCQTRAILLTFISCIFSFAFFLLYSDQYIATLVCWPFSYSFSILFNMDLFQDDCKLCDSSHPVYQSDKKINHSMGKTI